MTNLYESMMTRLTIELLVVYHLHEWTGRFTDWANGNKNSGLVNFVPKSCWPFQPFVRISSTLRKTVTKTWDQRCLWRNRIRISVWNIPSRKTGLPFQIFYCYWKSSAGTTQKAVFHSLSNRVFRKLLLNGEKNVTKKTLVRTLQTRMAKIFIATCTFYRIRFIDIVEQQYYLLN